MRGSIKVKTSELGGLRFGRLQSGMGVSQEEALGTLALFWADAERQSLEEGTKEEIERCLRDSGRFYSLLEAGYIEPVGERYVLPDLRGVSERRAKRLAISQHANKVRAENAAKKSKARAPKPPKAPKAEVITREAWDAYVEGYQARFGEVPLSNAANRSMMKRFVELVGAEDAPHVVRFYLQHSKKWYLDRMYRLQELVADAQPLHTQWKAGTMMDDSKAKQVSQALSYAQRQAEILAGRF